MAYHHWSNGDIIEHLVIFIQHRIDEANIPFPSIRSLLVDHREDTSWGNVQTASAKILRQLSCSWWWGPWASVRCLEGGWSPQ